MGKPYQLNKTYAIILLFVILLVFQIKSIAQNYIIGDKVYKKGIKTVQMYKNDGSDQTVLNPGVTTLDQNNPVVLEFDEIGDKANYYYAKIIHCNADWTKSSLADPEFMSEYNEFLIQEYSFSFNTRIHYTHYRFVLPNVKVSGNYLLIVYSSDNQEMVLSRRFLIVENIVKITPYFQVSELVGMRQSHQQVGFTVNYDQYEVFMPQTEFLAVIRQNQRWDNAKYNLQALYFDEGNKILDFRYFDDKINFPGWNEFRNFGIRNIRFEDANVQKLDLENQSVTVIPALNRSIKTYVNYIDLNGNYIIENNLGSKELSSDYFKTTISFRHEKMENDFYLSGQLTNYAYDDSSRFEFDTLSNMYRKEIFLKQGFYDYLISYESGNQESQPWIMEGSFFQTQNDYEIIIYHKAIGGRFERIVGYINRRFFND